MASEKILAEMARQQAAGIDKGNKSGRAQPEESLGDLSKKYSESELPGHAVWMDNQYKLHRMAGKERPTK